MRLSSISTPRGKESLHRIHMARGTWFWMNHLSPHLDTAAHDHTCLELAFVLGGNARHLTVRGSKPCRPGDVFIIPPTVWHGYAQCRNLEIYNCLLSAPLLQNELAWATHDNELAGLLPSPLTYNADILSLSVPSHHRTTLRKTLEFLHTLHNEPNASKARLMAGLLQLLDFLATKARKLRRSPAQTATLHASVRQALGAFHHDMARPWTLQALADELHINPSYLVRLFRSHAGLAPMKYLANRRAEMAATLLLSSQLSIGEIGQQVGWSDPKQFARSFRQFHGTNARQYRKRTLNRFAHSTDGYLPHQVARKRDV